MENLDSSPLPWPACFAHQEQGTTSGSLKKGLSEENEHQLRCGHSQWWWRELGWVTAALLRSQTIPKALGWSGEKMEAPSESICDAGSGSRKLPHGAPLIFFQSFEQSWIFLFPLSLSRKGKSGEEIFLKFFCWWRSWDQRLRTKGKSKVHFDVTASEDKLGASQMVTIKRIPLKVLSSFLSLFRNFLQEGRCWAPSKNSHANNNCCMFPESQDGLWWKGPWRWSRSISWHGQGHFPLD